MLLQPTTHRVHARCMLLLSILFASCFSAAYAQDVAVSTISASDVVANIAKQLPSLMRLITAASYVMGMFMVYHGMMLLKQYGQERTMMSSQHKLSGPIMALATGALLIYLPSSVQVGLSTFWSEPSPYGYLANQDQWSQFINNIYIIIQLFGTIALIRGLVILSHVGDRGGQQGSLGKGITHVMGGLFCINIYQFIQVVLVTLGVQTS